MAHGGGGGGYEMRDYDKEKDKLRDFLSLFYYEQDDGSKVFPYVEQIRQIAQREQVGLLVDLDDVHEHDPGLVEAIQENARRYHQLFHEVIDELVLEALAGRDPPVRDALDAFIYQRVYMERQQKINQAENPSIADIRRNEVTLKSRQIDKSLAVRDVKASHVGKLITVSGVVIRCTEVKPMAQVITYVCDTCGAETYQPVNGPSFMPALNCPSKDCVESRAHGRLVMQVRGSKFVKFQEFRIQEMSEDVPIGSIPRSLTINVYGENTRKAAPGDVVRVTGVYIPLLKHGFKQIAGGLVTEVYLEGHHVENTANNDENGLGAEAELTEEEVELVAQPNFYDLLAYSIAPEIYGHVDVKKSLLLALVGGVDKNAQGMKIRGTINLILMGDPGVAKSQLLAHMDRLAARSQYTTGRGSSGVGLTAAVMKDPLTGEMALEGGALVLADRGICCIDEFDKMMDADRTAIHEVMEQQTISIAKAGIMTTLNARVSIIAAANPAYGKYNPKKSVEQNIDLPAALLSRFDLLWLIQDRPDRESDKRLAEHIAYVHKTGHEPEKQGMKPLDMNLIRRYVAMCKRKHPIVPEALTERLIATYVQLRRDARIGTHGRPADTTFTSPRTLLAVIRMSTALARLRLADQVSEADVDEAIRLMEQSKMSLRPELPVGVKPIRPIDQAFAIIRELYMRTEGDGSERMIQMSEAVKKCISKGIDEQVLEECIKVYSATNVLAVDAHKRIYFL